MVNGVDFSRGGDRFPQAIKKKRGWENVKVFSISCERIRSLWNPDKNLGGKK